MKYSTTLATIKTLIENGLPFLLKGSPGTAKTSCVEQACAEIGVQCIVTHPVVADPTDYKGLPCEVNGEAVFLPFGELRQMMNATEKTVFFFDDLGQSTPAVQASIMQLILKREINGKKISDFVTFASATNGTKDKAGVKKLLQPLLSRQATILEIDVDVDEWANWALRAGLPTVLVAFIKFSGCGMLSNFDPNFVDETGDDMVNQPCPRTVEHVGQLFNCGLKSFEVLSGAIGQAFTVEFLAFVEIWEKLGKLPQDIANGKGGDCPTEPSMLFALTNCLSRLAKDETKFTNICSWLTENMPLEFGAKFVKEIETTSPECCEFDGFVEVNLHFVANAF
jgi:hypothetical protein